MLYLGVGHETFILLLTSFENRFLYSEFSLVKYWKGKSLAMEQFELDL